MDEQAKNIHNPVYPTGEYLLMNHGRLFFFELPNNNFQLNTANNLFGRVTGVRACQQFESVFFLF